MQWNTAFEAVPAGSDNLSDGDDAIRNLKTAVRERMVKEHAMNTSSGLAVDDGWHRQGSAIDYFQSTAPTTRPDGATALTSSDYGRRWIRSTDLTEYIYTSSGWVQLAYSLPMLENRTSDPSSPAVGRMWIRTDL